MSENVITDSAAGFLVNAGFWRLTHTDCEPLMSQDLLSEHENCDSVVLTKGWGNLMRRERQKSLKISATVEPTGKSIHHSTVALSVSLRYGFGLTQLRDNISLR